MISERSPAEELSSPDRWVVWAVVAALVAAGPVVACFLATQLLARRLGYGPELGMPWLVPVLPPWVYVLAGATALGLAGWLLGRPRARGLVWVAVVLAGLFAALVFGPLYPPFGILAWLGPALRDPATRAFGIEAALVAGAALLGLVAIGALPVRLRRSPVAEIAHGSARLASLADLESSGLTAPTGVRLGVFASGRKRILLHDDSEDHVLLIMPTGAGKTSGHIIPTLLSCRDSAFVLDPKGELWRTTSGWRRGEGHLCLYFSPTSTDREACCWNCLDEVRRGRELLLDLRVVAESLISTTSGDPHQSHWIASAQRLFQLLALHLIHHPSRAAPSVNDVRSLLNDPSRSLETLLKELVVFKHDPDSTRGFRSPVTGKESPTHPEVAMLARSFLSTPDRELGSIVSTLQRFLSLWADPLVARNTARSDFSLGQLLATEKPVTLYVALPYGDLEPLAPLLRILLGLLIRRMTEGSTPMGSQAGVGRRRTLFLLDEFAALGRLPILERMLGFFRGYGIRAVIVVQDLGQLVRSYSLQETISGNCQVHVAAATQSARTRAHLSSLAGEATVRYRRQSRSGGPEGWLRGRTTLAETETRRQLVTTGEVGTLPKDRLLILKTGLQPVLAWKSPYFKEPELVERSGIEPASRFERTEETAGREPPAPEEAASAEQPAPDSHPPVPEERAGLFAGLMGRGGRS